MAHTTDLGTIGLWSTAFRADTPDALGEIREAAAELEELGYGTLWIGGSPRLDDTAPLLEATERVTVGTSIASIWDQEAAEVAAGYAALTPERRERLVLGLGASHGHLAKDYARPFSAMKDYLTALDTAPVPLPAERRMLAALGPKMTTLAGERAAGALPYLVNAEHTARARELLGEGPVLAPELKVVLDADLSRARETAREFLSFYLPMPNYTNNLLRLGFTEEDFAGNGSDRLLDGVFALGDAEAASARVQEFIAAGADHIAVQVVLPGGIKHHRATLARAEWRALAEALPLGG
ncbi:TIGR03620 family F420-dependent LLM class oxidoreductase [Streptomyces albireticuli]|uniref:LLM class F420-dependent oxidoreductase n=1 Tax=Streptomyces albireticuli TaxID=1940 RepID=A0A2A2D0X4_9ACTN|nr:TIGR03620 family F420-dependent LLM class oxidoreductase [Streptomyces albireticuli]MCD9143619.1 TIGR03620 family F420-dependent LLM class oxidoreductase [Streptomyces albireticuli]MCD9161950.1 TIGR03620 family F420-dependent LLM class oxidoreductase [Streptomyces albireticuli]MCD9191736.1 TIGR03620 family F420-dependent LLM class oxidoreductase [Streptomyces albireticuli]PAU45107.1 LLM class F420-dependent oxidoreductase [Streptomyces albireticuli]